MKINKNLKKAMAYTCVAAMVVTSAPVTQPITVNAAIQLDSLSKLDYKDMHIQDPYTEQTVADGTAKISYAFVESESKGDEWIRWMAQGGYGNGDNVFVLWGNTNMAVKYSGDYPNTKIYINGEKILEDEGVAETQVNTQKYFKKDTYNELKLVNKNGDYVTFIIKVGEPTKNELGEAVTKPTQQYTEDGMYIYNNGGEFVNSGAWQVRYGDGAEGCYLYNEAADTYKTRITKQSDNEWAIQMAKRGVPVTAGKKYDYKVEVLSEKSETPGAIEWKVDGIETDLHSQELTAGENTLTGTFKATGATADFFFRMSKVAENADLTFKITLTEAAKTPEEIEEDNNIEAAKKLFNEDANLAKGKTAFAGSTGDGKPAASVLTDGSTGTGAWQANQNVENKTFGVDLGEKKSVKSVVVAWENAYATKYEIQISDDGEVYNTIETVDIDPTSNNPVKVTNLSEAVEARYIRINALEYSNFGQQYGISAFEIAAFAGKPTDIIAGGETPTTEAPTTEAPTTEAPTTEAPTTEAPTTEAPTTEAPTTEAPTTEAPTTEAPTTEAPTTGAPVETKDPIAPFGIVVTADANNTIVVTWGQNNDMIDLGQTYNVYVDGVLKLEGVATAAYTIENVAAGKHSVKVVAVLGDKTAEADPIEVTVKGSEETSTEAPTPTDGVNLIEGKTPVEWSGVGATFTDNEDGSVSIVIPECKSGNNFDTQYKYEGINLQEGKWYKATYTITSDVDKTFQTLIQHNGATDGNWAVLNENNQYTEVKAGETKNVEILIQAGADQSDILLGIMMGYVKETASDRANVTISNISFKEYSQKPAETPTEAPTTEAPTTEAPTTEAPTTEAPTTEAPTTEAPTTKALTTEAPTTTKAAENPTTIKAPTVKNTVVKKAARAKNNKKAKITLKSVKGVTGYQVQYSTSSKFKKATIKNVKKGKTYITIKLKANKKYYVRARAYVKKDGKIYYAKKWSKKKVLKVKK